MFYKQTLFNMSQIQIIRKLIFGLLLVTGANDTLAQVQYTTIPFPEDYESFAYKDWCITFLYDTANGKTSDGILLAIDDEDYSIDIDGDIYTVVIAPYYNEESGRIENKKYYFKEQEGRVYRYDMDSKSGRMVFDFTLSEGGSFVTPDGRRMVVESVGIAAAYPCYYSKGTGGYRKMIRLKDWDDPSNTDIWIEGIGSVYTGILSKSDFPVDEVYVDYMEHLSKKSTDCNELEYFTYNLDYYKSVPAVGTSAGSPENIDRYLQYRDDKINYIEFIDDTLHIDGFTLLYSAKCNVSAVIDGSDINLSFAAVTPFFAGWGLMDTKIDVKIPGFKPGKYTIHSPRAKDVTAVCWPKGWKNQCDINKDGKVDITDVVGVVNTIAGDTRYMDTSDVNSDGRTDITDVVDIINVISGQ